MANLRILISAGEPSGDLHGAYLMRTLQRFLPQVEFWGVGGEKMLKAGLNPIVNMEGLSIMGFQEVIPKFFKLKSAFFKISSWIEKEDFSCFIPIDYPGMNLRLAQKVWEKGVKTIYYITPQLWAWGKGRIKWLKRFVDKLIVILPFEEDFYRREGMDVHFVGHPLLDMVWPEVSSEEFLSEYPLDPPIIGLLPGSREEEVERILPVMLEIYQKLKHKKINFALLKAESISEEPLKRFLKDTPLPVIKSYPYTFLSLCSLILTASGTVTLEAAILGTPMVILYRVSPLTWILGKMLVKTPFVGLVNIIAGKKVVPEFVGVTLNTSLITEEIMKMLEKENSLKVKEELKRVKEKLGERGAVERASRIILKEIAP